MKTGIFGCSADPFTPAHKAIIDIILKEKLVDRVIISPTVVSYHRTGKMPWLSDNQKLEVIDSFWEGSMPDNIILNDNDLRLKKLCVNSAGLTSRCITSRRYIDTLLNIKAWLGPNDEYFTIIGTDSAKNFESWHLYKEILDQSRLIVIFGRDGNDIQPLNFPYIPIRIPSDYENISATRIREKYAADPNGIKTYIDDIKSGKFMKDYQKDRVAGRIVFFKNEPVLYVNREVSYKLVCSTDREQNIFALDNKYVIAEGKKCDDSFLLEKVINFQGD